MSEPLHYHYHQLTDAERDWVDGVFAEIMATPRGQEGRPPLATDDRIERAVNALARAIIESRDCSLVQTHGMVTQ